jgi:hypothetical protein
VHFAPPAGTSAQPGQYPISATPGDTPREPRGPWALPGQFTVRLTAGGKTYTQPLTIKMDPRVKTPTTVLAQLHATSVRLFDAITRDSLVADRARIARAQLRDIREHAGAHAAALQAIDAFEQQLNAVVGQSGGSRGRGGGGGGGGGGGRGVGAGGGQPTFASINGELLSLLAFVEDSDAPLTTQATAAVAAAERDVATLGTRWTTLRTTGLTDLNAKLKAAGQPPLVIAP